MQAFKKQVAEVPARPTSLVRLRTKTSTDSLEDAVVNAEDYITPPRTTRKIVTPPSKSTPGSTSADSASTKKSLLGLIGEYSQLENTHIFWPMQRFAMYMLAVATIYM